MFFCTNCDNLYDLTKTVPTVVQSRLTQKGGEILSDTPDTVSSATEPELDIDKLINKVLCSQNKIISQ